MQEGDYRQMEMEQNGMQVILKFPKVSNDEERVKREVKEILSNILQEQLIKIS